MWHVEFQDLFPDRAKVTDGDHMTVISLSQRTQNDMTSWDDDVEQERENLLQNVRMSQSWKCPFCQRRWLCFPVITTYYGCTEYCIILFGQIQITRYIIWPNRAYYSYLVKFLGRLRRVDLITWVRCLSVLVRPQKVFPIPMKSGM